MQRLRQMGHVTRKFTNFFVKNIGEELSNDKRKERCSENLAKLHQFTSVAVMRDGDGKKANGYGFVAFETPEAAEAVRFSF